MKENELVRDMYSCLNLAINELNSIGINKLDDADIVRKIISLPPQQKYGSIITILHNLEDLSKMTLTLLVGKIVAFDMSWKMGLEESTSSKPCAFTCDEHKDKRQEEGWKLKFREWRRVIWRRRRWWKRRWSSLYIILRGWKNNMTRQKDNEDDS
jgi:hypothetical protein